MRQPPTWRSKSSMMSSWLPLAAYIRPGHHGDDEGDEGDDNDDDEGDEDDDDESDDDDDRH